MLAILGHLVTTAGARVPLGPNEVKNGLAALDTCPTAGLAFSFLTVGAIELGFASIKGFTASGCTGIAGGNSTTSGSEGAKVWATGRSRCKRRW